ncbi:MAG: hypothetical protein ACI8RD_010104 [Bacillariaceae sp.]
MFFFSHLGHSGQAREELFDEVIGIVNRPKDTGSQDNKLIKSSASSASSASSSTSLKDEMIGELKEVIELGQESNSNSTQREAELIYKLAIATKTTPGTPGTLSSLSTKSELESLSIKGGLLDMDIISNPNPNVVCSLTVPSTMTSTSLDCERPVSPTACGHYNENFGPELMFSHTFTTLYDSPYYNSNKLGIVKVGQGGTQIQQWLKKDDKKKKRILDIDTTKKNEIIELDNYWLTLRDSIRAAAGTIEAFVWFQGENEDVGLISSTATEDMYYKRLQKLVSDVRGEIFMAYTNNQDKNNNSKMILKFEKPKDIPVVIIELGSCFAEAAAIITEEEGYEFPGPIIAAQRKFVNIDSNSIIVNTGANIDRTKQLSPFYHFDAPSMLVIGDRVAKALATLSSSQYDKQQSNDAKQSPYSATSKIATTETTSTSSLTKTDPKSITTTGIQI